MKQQWILCDMHTHSEYSAKNKPGEPVKHMLPSEYVEILHAHGVKLFSITDHNYFSSDYYLGVEEYIKQSNYEMAIIPGTELDVYVETEKGEKYIHVCFYFSGDISYKQLEEVISKLYKDEAGSELYPTFDMIIEKLYELNGKFIIVPHGDKDRGLFKVVKQLTGKDKYYKYALYKVFNAYDVKPEFYSKNLKFWAAEFYEKTKTFNDYINNKTEKEIEAIKEAVIYKIKDDAYVLNEEEQYIYEYILNYGSYYAYFSFSDWHNKNYYNPRINNFIFGDMSLPFESFEMSMLDPESRIIQSGEKEIDISNAILESVDFCINGDKKHICFSPGFNAVVGKRGSGKSLLLAVLRNLSDKDSEDGALKKYKSLHITGITAKTRDGISVSMGSLNSVAFLSQNDVNEIFDNPNKAEQSISDYFKTINNINLAPIKDIIELAKKIKQYNKNYKSITSAIQSIKEKGTDYSIAEYNFEYKNELITYFKHAKSNLAKAEQEISELKVNTDLITSEIQRIGEIESYYQTLLQKDNILIKGHNERIRGDKKNRSENSINQQQNRASIANAMKILKDNLENQLNYKKLCYLIENLDIKNPEVEIRQRGKYAFATYYDIPKNLKQEVEERLFESLVRGNSTKHINEYMDGLKDLKKTSTSLASELERYITGEVFKCKKSFYEIIDDSVSCEEQIKGLDDIAHLVETGKLVDLTNQSLGTKSVAYLNMLFDLDEAILVFDQPEDNIDNDYISTYLVPNIKKNKKIKQLIFVTHNPSVAVYGDAFNYVFAENNGDIEYKNYYIEKAEDKDALMKILEGGRASFSNRNKKFGNVLGEEEYGNN